MNDPLRLFLVAGEPSGDRLGASLMTGLRRRSSRPVEFLGLGGDQMESEGLDPIFPISDIAVIGVFEVIPRLRTLADRIRRTADAAIAANPDALVTIDSPGFTLRVAPKVRAAAPQIPILHYVAPSVWAWRPNRAKLMARYVDHVLALLPFEPPHMEAAGMSCDFVGHPVAEHRKPPEAEIVELRRELGVEGRLLTVLLGSRRSEVARLSGPFGAAVARLVEADPSLTIAVPAASAVAEETRQAVASWSGRVRLLDPRALPAPEAERRKLAVFAASDAALAASGTVAVELAAMGAPQVTAYRMNPATAFVVERLVRVPSANLVNLIAGENVVPEFLQRYCTPDALAAAVSRLLEDEVARERQRDAARRVIAVLGGEGPPPSTKAAESVLRHLSAPITEEAG